MSTRKEVFNLIASTMLGVIAVVLSMFGQFFPQTIKIQFDDTILMLNGLVFGPFYAIVVGIVADLVSVVVNGYSFFPGFTLNSILYGLIPILFIKLLKGRDALKYVIFGMSLLFFIGSGYYILNADSIASVTSTNFTKVIFLVITIINVIIVAVAIFKTRSSDKSLSYAESIFIVLIVAFLINILLTPIWIKILYGTPIITSIQIRLFKAILLLPLDAFLLYKLYNVYIEVLEDRY